MAGKPEPSVAKRTSEEKEPRSYAGWIAALFVVALVGWMGSGYLYPDPAPAKDTPRSSDTTPFTVEAFESRAKPVTRFVAAEGQVVPDRMTPVRAKVGGTVEEVFARKGDFLQEGAPIAKIALDDRAAQQTQAEAELARRQSEYDRVSNLSERGYATAADREAAEANLATAKAELAAVRQTAGDTQISAPITGVLDGFDLDLGEFVAAGAEVGMQVDNDPLTVDIEVAQQNVGRIAVGQPAAIGFITGETRQGEVTYIAANADAATRTFPVEITVPNPKRDIPAGISAQIRIPTDEIAAHFVSAALLALGPDGELGVKSVDENGTVAFFPVELVRAETDGIWVSGLPESLRIISVGQGFVSDGEKVEVDTADPSTESPLPDPLVVPAVPQAAVEPDRGGDDVASLSPGEMAEGLAALASGSTTSQNAAADGAATSGWSVELLQTRLNELGYTVGPVDGIMGESTREAVRAFQREQGLPVDGEVTPSLAAALVSASPAQGDASGDQP